MKFFKVIYRLWLFCFLIFFLNPQTCRAQIWLSGVLLKEAEDGKPYPGLLVSAQGGINSKSDTQGRFQMGFEAERKEQEGSLLVDYPEGWKVMFSG